MEADRPAQAGKGAVMNKKPAYGKWIFWTVVGILALIAVFFLFRNR